MGSLFAAQGVVLLILGVLALAVQGFALFDAATSRADAFPATSNQTKATWVAITAVCLAVGFVCLRSPLNFINLLAIVGAGVYLTRVRPAIRAITGKGGGRGPYGW